MNILCSHCKAYHWSAERLTASPESRPKFGICCSHGLVRIPLMREPPEALKSLWEGPTPDAIEFRTNIRRYNAALAFTSLGVEIDHEINTRGGQAPYVFRIHGELCHRVGQLIRTQGRRPVYAQLYIYDPEIALNERMQHEVNRDLSERTMRRLQNALTSHHRYATLFRNAHELLDQHPVDSPITIRFLADPTRDQRRYNLPTVSEIAAVIPGDGTQATDSRNIILHRRNGPLQRISDGHRSYCCLHYVLFFP
ncbi:hypothetical protein EV363DRAFT_1149524, partial [Boletus edulis]